MQGGPIILVKLLMKLTKKFNELLKQYERCKQILLEHEEQLKLIAKHYFQKKH